MLASLMRSVQVRTGDGRVKHSDSGGQAGRDDAIKPGRKVGDGAQALAWGGVTFQKLPPPSASASTSPETDPGDSDLFPFFKDEEEELEEDENAEELPGERERQVDTDASKEKALRKLDFQNPLFHMPLESDSLKEMQQTNATASMFSGQQGGSQAPPINGSNPMFSRTSKTSAEDSSGGAVRSKSRERKEKDLTSGKKSPNSKSGSKDACKDGKHGKDRPEGSTGSRKPKKKKEKAVYEHVGRIDVLPSEDDPSADASATKKQPRHLAFRVDTFARNEGENNGVAHFKFVFTFEPGNTARTHRLRPVLDAVHERDTGKIRVAVNDGRVATATRSAIEVVLPNIGAVLFNPRMQAKGHHLYTLTFGKSTLFSVLA